MFKRKFYISILLAFIITLFFSVGDSFLEGYGTILDGWFMYVFFVFPCFLFFALPVSLIADVVTRGIDNQMGRRFLSLIIHTGFGFVVFFSDIGYAILVAIIAFVFYVLDEVCRSFRESPLFQRNLTVIGNALCILSVGLWVIAAIKIYS